MTTTIAMAPNGRLVVPAPLRRELGLEGESTLLADVVDCRLVLRAAVVVDRAEQEWLESDAVTALIESADRSIAEGRTRPLDTAAIDRIRAARDARRTPRSKSKSPARTT